MASETVFRTVNDALEYLNSLNDSDITDNSDEEYDLCQLPPEENERLTDNEDIDDNNLGEVEPTDVCGQVSLFIKSCASVSNDTQQESFPSTSKELPAPKRNCKRKANSKPGVKGKHIPEKPNWQKTTSFSYVLPSENQAKLCDKFPKLIYLEPIDLFFEFLNIDYLTHLAEMTTLYAAQHGSYLQFEWKDIAQFFGLLLLSGYHIVPTEDFYWSTAEDIEVSIVSTVMSRNRFREIKANFHVMDNSTINVGDKLAKIRPLYDELNKQFMKFGIFHNTLSIDESMVPYYGHHSCKMFIRGKPIRFGYKIWMLCSSNGFPYSMDIYSGKSDLSTPLGKRVVNHLLAAVSNPLEIAVYFDNFFTSYDLLAELRSKKIKATGTVRENRIAKCPLIPAKEKSKTKRGTYDYLSDGKVYVCRWNDNSVVTIASNHETHLPLQSAKRYSKEKRTRVAIDQPRLLRQYNYGMGGVDVMDRLLGSYRPKLRSKKWWWNLFSNALNMSVVAAWIVHKELHSKPSSLHLDHLSFRRQITMALLRISPRKEGPRVGPKPRMPPSQRKSDGHYLISASQGRCAHCNSNTKYQCNECKKRIHIECFPYFHGLKV